MYLNIRTVFASCGGEICKFYARCQSQTCVCPRVCTANYNPVVGSDGITYGNMCHMHIASCEKQKLIQPYVCKFILGGLTLLLNICGDITTVLACSSGTLINVLPHRNAMPQTQDTTPHPVTVY